MESRSQVVWQAARRSHERVRSAARSCEAERGVPVRIDAGVGPVRTRPATPGGRTGRALGVTRAVQRSPLPRPLTSPSRPARTGKDEGLSDHHERRERRRAPARPAGSTHPPAGPSRPPGRIRRRGPTRLDAAGAGDGEESASPRPDGCRGAGGDGNDGANDGATESPKAAEGRPAGAAGAGAAKREGEADRAEAPPASSPEGIHARPRPGPPP